MADKPWHVKLLKANPNLSLKDVLEYKVHEVELLSESVIADKISKIDEGVAAGILKKEGAEEKKKKIREDAKKEHYTYDLPSLAEKLLKLKIKLNIETSPIAGLDFLNHLLDEPEAAIPFIVTQDDFDKLVSFFSTQFTIPKEDMLGIMKNKKSESPKVATTPTKVKKVKEEDPVEPIEDSDKTKIVIKNCSDFSHLITVSKGKDGAIKITLHHDTKSVGLSTGEQSVHSRKQVQLYANDGPLTMMVKEYDVHTASVIL